MNHQKALASILSMVTPAKERGPMTLEEEREDFIRRYSDQRSLLELQRQVKLQREKEEHAVIKPEEEEFDFDKALAELEEARKQSIKDNPLDLEEVLKEAEEYYRQEPMYDWGAREMSNEHDMSMKYGSKITNQIRSCQYHAEPIPKSLIAEMHGIHEGKRPLQKKVVPITPAISQSQKTGQVNWDKKEKKTKLEPTVFKNNRYLNLKAGVLNMTRKCRSLQNPTTLLYYLLLNRNWEQKKDKHDTYGTWYLKRNLIVASVGVEKMSADLGVSEKTIRNWGNKLERDCLIKKVMEGKENVYVLGEVIDGKELLYSSGEISFKHGPDSVH